MLWLATAATANDDKNGCRHKVDNVKSQNVDLDGCIVRGRRRQAKWHPAG